MTPDQSPPRHHPLDGSSVAMVTPFRNGSIDHDAVTALIDMHIAAGTDAILLCGTTGESPTLDHDEHAQIIELGIKHAAGRIPIIAGTGSNATAEAINLTQRAVAAKADAALIVTPYYNKPSQEGLIAHFLAIHHACPDIDIIIYNIPSRSVIDMTPETMKYLAARRRFIGVKDATGDITRVSDMRRLLGDDFLQLSGEDASILGFMAQGGHGCISVTANVAPKLCAEFHDACRRGDFTAARKLHDRLYPLHRALFMEPNPAPVKYALHRLDLCQADLRLPMIPVATNTASMIDQALQHAGLSGD